VMASPQRAQTGPDWTGNSDQQTGQIGTEESSGKGEPQRAQEEGSRAQLKLSIGLRSTRTTARQRVVCANGTSAVRIAVSLEKTHLASGQKPNRCSPMRQVYRMAGILACGPEEIVALSRGLKGLFSTPRRNEGEGWGTNFLRIGKSGPRAGLDSCNPRSPNARDRGHPLFAPIFCGGDRARKATAGPSTPLRMTALKMSFVVSHPSPKKAMDGAPISCNG